MALTQGARSGGSATGAQSGGYVTLNGVTDDGRQSAVVAMSEARGDTQEHILDQENAAGALIDHALCAGAGGRGSSGRKVTLSVRPEYCC